MDHSILLRDYSDSDADAVARMWEESRDGWPPGFFGASATTAESVRQEERTSGGLFTALAWLGDRAVGFCKTTPYGGEQDATYVALLSVVPDLHGKKVGKKLLLDAVTRVADKGYYRIDLHTWPANTKAVPLYKKTGFFWVPDSMVYMQNYMPFLLQRPEFKEFLGDGWWYDHFDRELKIEHDEEKTESGRDVFTYVFRKDEKEFRAVFDRTGRMLCSLDTPDFSASMERSNGKVYFGVPVTLSLSGRSLPRNVSVCSDTSLKATESFNTDGDGFRVTAAPLRVPKTQRDRAPRVSVKLSSAEPLEIGLGLRAEEPVSMVSPTFRFISPGQKTLELDLKRLADANDVVLRYSVDKGEETEKAVKLSDNVFQTCTLDLPDLGSGIHTLRFVLVWKGVESYPETVVLVTGPHSGDPVVVDTRHSMLIVGEDTVLRIDRKGATGLLWGRSMDDRPERLVFLRTAAGPPLWGSDLPLQVYDLEERDGTVVASTDWPSRKGMKHFSVFRLERSGLVEVRSSVENGSDTDQKVIFRVSWSGMEIISPRTDIIPLKGSLHVEQSVYNQLPDWTEDLPHNTEELGAPWIGLLGPDRAVMSYFEGWSAMRYGRPETSDIIVPPGESASSPPFLLLYTEGGLKSILRKAMSLGWRIGETERLLPFPDHNVEPIMCNGSCISLTHGFKGERKGAISVDGSEIACGPVKSGSVISGEASGTGPVEVMLDVAGRSFSVPSFLVGKDCKVITEELTDGTLLISNGRLKALIDPSQCGHVFSLELDDTEYLLASHPDPGEMAWEKPWFGGIHPRISTSQQSPFRLQDHRPETRLLEKLTGNLTERGWEQIWKVNHKKYGSFLLRWEVTLLPSVPVLRSRLDAEPLAGSAIGGEIDLRGFIQPGGELSNGILSCQSNPSLRQGRKHSGAWGQMGKWARVESPGKGFVEAYTLGDGTFFCEDYSGEGCHLAVFCPLSRRRTVEMLWLFGTGEEEKLSDILRFHV